MNLLLGSLLPVFLGITSNDTIKVHLHISGLQKNSVRITSPIKDAYLPAYKTIYDSSYIGDQTFDIKIPAVSASFFIIWINDETGISIALSPNDSIAIFSKRNNNSGFTRYEHKVSGNNSEAHNIYQKRFYPAGRSFGIFEELVKRSKTYQHYFIETKKLIDSTVHVWDSLQRNNLVSADLFKLYKADVTASLYNQAIKRMGSVKTNDSSADGDYTKLSIKRVMQFYSGASDPMLLKTYSGSVHHRRYLSQILQTDYSISDSSLKSSSLNYFYLFDTAYREEAWGSLIYLLRKQFPSADITKDRTPFEKLYPASTYITLLDQFSDSVREVRRNAGTPPQVHSTSHNSLLELVQKSASRFAFIDVWATWCIPCIQEFSHLDLLTKYFQNNNIAQIFLSIDDESDRKKWENFIAENYISGDHYLISEEIQNDLLKVLSATGSGNTLSIPRYLLYDRSLNKFHLNLPRPSSGKVLMNELDRILAN